MTKFKSHLCDSKHYAACFISCAALLMVCGGASAQLVVSDTEIEKVAVNLPEKVTAALFVYDRTSGGNCKSFLAAFGDELAAALNKDGFGVVRTEYALGMAESVDGAQDRAMINQQVEKGAQLPLDYETIIQLARDVNADCAFVASVTGAREIHVGASGVLKDFRITVALNGYGAQVGDGMYGEVVTCAKRFNAKMFDLNKDANIEAALLESANKLATSFATGFPKLKPRKANMAKVTFNARLNANSALLGFEKNRDEKGNLVETDNDIPIYAHVYVDGMAMGTTQGVITMPEGLHTVSVEYKYCDPYVRRARFMDGQVYNVDLKFNDEGIKRYKDVKLWDLEYNYEKVRRDLALKHAENCVADFNRQWNAKIDIIETNAFTAARIAETTCNRAFDAWLKEIEADVTKTVDKHAAAVKVSANEAQAKTVAAEKQAELTKIWAEALSYVMRRDSDGRYLVADGEGKFRSESYWRNEFQERNSKTEVSEGVDKVTTDTKSTEINTERKEESKSK